MKKPRKSKGTKKGKAKAILSDDEIATTGTASTSAAANQQSAKAPRKAGKSHRHPGHVVAEQVIRDLGFDVPDAFGDEDDTMKPAEPKHLHDLRLVKSSVLQDALHW